jgi:hypothetical protein
MVFFPTGGGGLYMNRISASTMVTAHAGLGALVDAYYDETARNDGYNLHTTKQYCIDILGC